MKRIRVIHFLVLAGIFSCMAVSTLHAQDKKAMESITADELKGHIYFLASDEMGGRIGVSEEYELAAQYVKTQFAAAGLEPLIKDEDGKGTYIQGVPFAKTTYSDHISWKIITSSKETELAHKNDFKILFGSKLSHDKTGIVYVGYGIEEPDHKWNDFEGLDVEGKIIVVIGGAPVKKGKPVLPEELHNEYTGMRGFQSKIGTLFSKGAEGIIVVDIDGSTGMPFAMIPSEFDTEKYVYKGENSQRRSPRSSIYLAQPGIFELLMPGMKNNPVNDPENIYKGYEPQELPDTYLDAKIEILNEELVAASNVVGFVPGTDPDLKDEYIVVGAHLDHVKPVMGQVCNGADDNASGSSGVIEIAEAIAMNPCKRPVVFVTWAAEEMGLLGSRYFVGSGVIPLEQLKFNLNMDMIGRSSPENEESRAHYVVTNKRYIDKLGQFINDLNKDITDFPLIIDNDEDSPGGSDHQSFISEGIPAFFFFSGVHNDLHQPGDDPDKIDYPKAEKICRLGYSIVAKLANMESVPTFE